MQAESNSRKQVNQYDKIIKENLEVTLPVIIRDILALDVLISEELPDDIQHTKERKPDALKKITDLSGNTYVLHVEFPLKDEKEMVYRMAEYSIMLMRKYQLPIKQYVIFMGDTDPLMRNYLNTDHHKYDFTLIKLSEANFKVFLKSDNPEVKMLGILAKFDRDDSYSAVKSIVDGIQSTAKSDLRKADILDNCVYLYSYAIVLNHN
ncbi:hypothetical protein SAMN06265348_11673 [Pedobacter westerhofensis]|uniref:Transposase, YhgA-like n=1 Tax=Pedobacter westerhofensis TaxID=425512 RepID=A0A521FQG3_9SPHI|nr:hypothetical protein [Pedobacter westerhofensis]SMO98356.1 hypothetical protein SAMN06265348_11673 [Pedobacter westerhofensis]